DPRVDDDHLPAVLAGLPDVVRGDRRALRGVRPGDEHDLGLEDVVPRIRAAVDAEGLLVRGAGADHAEAAVVVDVLRLQADPGELPHQIGLLRGQAGAGEDAEGVRTVGVLNAFNFRGNAGDGVGVRHRGEAALRPRVAAQRGGEAV